MRARPDHVFHGNGGELLLWLPADHLYITRVCGHLDVAMATAFLDVLEPWTEKRARALTAFHDWEAMTNYDSAARMALVTWTVERRAILPHVHLLVRSKIVELGVEVANFTLGRFMRTHRDRPSFLGALKETLLRDRIEFAI